MHLPPLTVALTHTFFLSRLWSFTKELISWSPMPLSTLSLEAYWMSQRRCGTRWEIKAAGNRLGLPAQRLPPERGCEGLTRGFTKCGGWSALPCSPLSPPLVPSSVYRHLLCASYLCFRSSPLPLACSPTPFFRFVFNRNVVPKRPTILCLNLPIHPSPSQLLEKNAFSLLGNVNNCCWLEMSILAKLQKLMRSSIQPLDMTCFFSF